MVVKLASAPRIRKLPGQWRCKQTQERERRGNVAWRWKGEES